MYIGIDLGTTGCKVVMYSSSGASLCEYNKEYELIMSDTFVEQDASVWWQLTKEGISEVVHKTGISEVKGISVSTQGISFVPVDAFGTPLYNAISWLDMRATYECELLRDAFGESCIFEKTGKHCEPDYTLPKLMWFKNHCTDIYNKADKILLPLDFLNLKLTGRAVTDYTIAGGTMLYNIVDKCWDKELISFADIDTDKLPAVGSLGDVVGELLPSVARACGITGECTVYLGGQDQKLAAIGAGISDEDCTVSFGTATAISKLTRLPDFSGSASQFRFDDTKFISEIAIMTTGAALRWLSRSMFGGLTYREMDILAAKSCPGAGGVTFMPDLSCGGVISGLTLSTNRSDVIYALYEGVSKQIKAAVDSLGGARRLLVFGGGAKSRIWCSILARVSETDVCVLETSETASLGAAIIASRSKIPAAGIFETINAVN